MIDTVMKTLSLVADLYQANEADAAERALKQAAQEYRHTSNQTRQDSIAHINFQIVRLKKQREALLTIPDGLMGSQRTRALQVIESVLETTLDVELQSLLSKKRQQSKG